MKKTYLLLILLITVIGCEKEEISENKDVEIASELATQKIQFSEILFLITDIFNEENYIKNKKSDSSNSFGSARTDIPAYKNESKTGVTYTIALQKETADGKLANSNLYFDNVVIKQNATGAIEKFVFRYEPTLTWYKGSRELSKYSGFVTLFGIEGSKLGKIRMVDGKEVGETKVSCALIFEGMICTGGLYGLEGSCTYTYGLSCPGSGTDGYSDTTTTGSGWDSGYTSGETGGGTGTTAGSTSTITATPILNENGEFVEEEDTATVQIYNELEGKELCAYNRLKWAGVNASNYVNLMTQLFTEFGEGNIGSADLVITERDLGYRGGGTFRRSDGKFEIVLSRMVNSSSIEIAAVLVHEMAHACLAKHYSLYNNSFEELYSMYLNDHGLASYSHDIMGDKFIYRMAQVLYDYDNTLFTNFDDYKILASAGVYEFDEDQLAEYNLVRNYAKINDERCQNVD